ncbi:MAG: intermembrane phospholipid transport protein YdbH family protein [Sphingomonas sp.]
MTAASEDLPEAELRVDEATPRRHRLGRWLGGAALVAVVAVCGVWVERKPIASHYVDATLARDQVPARYRIADLGLGRQRLTDVVIGDPAHPDLVADWLEVHTTMGFHGVHVTGVSGGHVRLRGRLVDGHLSLGTLDRLLPPPSGKPFALPSITANVQDARMRLETPYGVVGIKATGSGRLDNGFSGQVAAISDALQFGGCRIDRAAATVAIHIADARPTITGPLRAGAVQCAGMAARHLMADVDATLGDRLDRWQGKAVLALGEARRGATRVADVGGTIDFTGSPERTSGTVDLTSGAFRTPAADGAVLHLSGGYRVEDNFLGFQGAARASDARLSPGWLDRIGGLAGAGQGTPLAPLAIKLAKAGAAAARNFDIDADIDALQSKGLGRVGVTRLVVSTASGAEATLTSGEGIQYGWPHDGLHIDGMLAVSGGELPEAVVRLSQDHAGAPVNGSAIIRPYAAGGARLALSPVQFAASPSGKTRFATTVSLSGPLGADGRLDDARMAVTGLWDGHQRVLIDPACVPLSFQHLKLSGLVLGATQLRLCPQGPALLAIDGARVTAGARLAATHLQGALGSTPLDITAGGGTLALGDRGFALDDLAVRLGGEGRVTRLDFARLDGRLGTAAVAGRFSGGGGQIANVPLILSKAAGNWTFDGGRLALNGDVTVSDAADQPRFNPLVSHDVALALADGRITANATLQAPKNGAKVADVTLVHDLAAGAGRADLAVPGITFGKDFQPDALTPLTLGVIADVNGSVSGDAHIAWSPDGVTSTGTFSTKGTNLAAAFGPVTGLSTTVHFTDLLNMVSAPDQVATVDEINPGVAVEDGVVHYRLLSSTSVKVDGARWPFSGGTLTLDPTLLDFSGGQPKRLTFRIDGMDTAQFIQKFDFKNIDATGTFDGVLPMVFDVNGGRIEHGTLKARTGGTLAYVGGVSQKDLGTWGNMAFEALKALKYDSLDVTLDGPLAGEMVTQVHFAGIKQGKGTHTNFLVKRLMRLPFVFNVTIRAPFRQLISSAQSIYDPNQLPSGKLDELIRAEKQRDAAAPAKPTIQAPESETVQ